MMVNFGYGQISPDSSVFLFVFMATNTAKNDYRDYSDTDLDTYSASDNSVGTNRGTLYSDSTKQEESVAIQSNTNEYYGVDEQYSYDYEDEEDDEEEYDDEEDDLYKHPEYRPGGKYDPAKYHMDYAGEEKRRRRYIDNDGFDDDDGYDEWYGYQHEYERSARWK